MIAFITNMSTAHNVTGDKVTARQLISEWIDAEDVDLGDYDGDEAEAFLNQFTVTVVNNGNGVNDENLDTALPDGSTLSIHTRAVATGGSKGACC